MKFIKFDDIYIASRQRKAMDPSALKALEDDIGSRGLMHAILVRYHPVDDRLYLVAGERRLTAIKSLAKSGVLVRYDEQDVPLGCIPCTFLSNPDEIAHREAELHENILREDLSWQDKMAAVNELHQLRSAQQPEQTKLATAQELAGKQNFSMPHAQRLVDQATLLAGHMSDPDVARAPDVKTALGIATRKMEAMFTSKLAESVGSGASEHTLIQSGFQEWIIQRSIDTPKFSCIIADPPYGMAADTFGAAAQNSHQYQDDKATALAIAKSIFADGFEITREDAHLYMFCDLALFSTLHQMAMTYGWQPMIKPLIWIKSSAGHVPDQSLGWRRTYETILFARRGARPLARVANDTLDFAPEKEKIHAAQKPVELYKYLLSLSCLPGDHVLDPCCGSGTIFKAANQLKLRATGVEPNEQYHAFAAAAIAGLGTVGTPTVAAGAKLANL